MYYKEDIKWFDIEYGIYFTIETGLSIFLRVRSKPVKYEENLSQNYLMTKICHKIKIYYKIYISCFTKIS